MWLLVFFKAETGVGQGFKACVFGLAAVALYVGLTTQPPSGVIDAVALLVIGVLCLHGLVTMRRTPSVKAACVVDIRPSERRIGVTGGGIDIALDLASRTLTVRRMAKSFIPSDAPGEFRRERAGRFGWPFSMIPSSEPEQTRVEVRWTHPQHGERALFTITGPSDRYAALTEAFAVFAGWIDEDDEARRAIERRQEAEAWQRDWEAQRLAEEIEEARRKAQHHGGPNEADHAPPYRSAFYDDRA